jgi:hypothetical protein
MERKGLLAPKAATADIIINPVFPVISEEYGNGGMNSA